ncbi:hypothetical protein PsorP6_015928 [Peronosclerospora sorghi]|uniref:Uncharacterized protein n=1 Tax=Peronosclerospora sorghi TaxID=230839 RepID=A0ACC0WMZ1_9STRA|nr:hypothetical protein PsorP6_015928 [Peronosclerospora sorghi]
MDALQVLARRYHGTDDPTTTARMEPTVEEQELARAAFVSDPRELALLEAMLALPHCLAGLACAHHASPESKGHEPTTIYIVSSIS